jgi:hypothetical protein
MFVAVLFWRNELEEFAVPILFKKMRFNGPIGSFSMANIVTLVF